MPVTLSAKRSWRKSLKNQKSNITFKSGYKKLVKEYLLTPSVEALKKVYSVLDKAGKKNIFHKNKVSRLKSKFAKKMKVAPKGSNQR